MPPSSPPEQPPAGTEAPREEYPGERWAGPWSGGEWWRHRHGPRGGPLHRRLRGPIRRSPDTRVLAGVCGGLSLATGIDVTIVRIGFVLLTLGSGIGIPLYALAWLLIPLQGETTTIFTRSLNDRRGLRLVIALIPILVAVQLVADELHIGFLTSFTWPVFLALGVAILIRRNASEGERLWINDDLLPVLRQGDDHHPRWSLVLRIAVGVAIGVGGLLVLILGHTSRAALRPVGGALLVIAAIVVIFGPWWLSLLRDLMSERQARALAEERAQMAAHVHDSVLQTLALIQRSADDPRHVVQLARAQERELRSWLFEGRPPGAIGQAASTVSEGVAMIQRQIEADHGVTVQVVVVGDCPLDEGLRALLDASREATVNSAKWSGSSQVSLYAEVERECVMVFVRDRGQGFDPEAVPHDRQGIAQSIRGRMTRFGGSVVIRSAPGDGAEVELSMPRRERVR